jgi:tellurite resistance protein TehA-like permease
MTLFSYALLATTGAYLTGAILVLLGRWETPLRPSWWAVTIGIVAFAVDRLVPQYSVEAAPVVCLCTIVVGTQIVRSPGIFGLRNLLWSLFVLVPIAFMLAISSAEFFPATDATALRDAAAGLFAVPGIAAILGGFARAISPAPRR